MLQPHTHTHTHTYTARPTIALITFVLVGMCGCWHVYALWMCRCGHAHMNVVYTSRYVCACVWSIHVGGLARLRQPSPQTSPLADYGVLP